MGSKEIRSFISKNNVFAVVGVSSNKKKYGYKVFMQLIRDGFKVYGINPKYKELEGIKIYPTLSSLPKKPDVVITVVPPIVSEKIIEEVSSLGIQKVWFQPGSENDVVIKKCKEKGISCIYKMCFVVDGLKEGFHDFSI